MKVVIENGKAIIDGENEVVEVPKGTTVTQAFNTVEVKNFVFKVEEQK